MTRFDSITDAVSNHKYLLFEDVEIIPTKSHTYLTANEKDILSIDWGERTITLISKPETKRVRRIVNSVLFFMKTGYKMEDKKGIHTLRGCGSGDGPMRLLKMSYQLFDDSKVIRFYK